jgi:hypothetical protein
VRLAALPAREAADLLLAVPQAEALRPSGATVISITVDSHIDPLIGPKEILNTRSLCNSNDAAALQRVRLRQGDKIWQKSYRFLSNGVYHQRKKPSGKQHHELPPNQWKSFETRLYQYNGNDSECPAVLEPGELLYLVSVINFTGQKSALRLCVFDKSQLYRVTVTAEESRQLKVNYVERLPDKQFRREGAIDAIKISFQPRVLDPEDKKPEEFSFLGLQGDFDIFIDKTSRIPVRVSGKIAAFGKVEINLQEVSLIPEN